MFIPALLAAVATDGYHGEEVAQVRRLTPPVDDGETAGSPVGRMLPPVMSNT